jgi:hypothetical protein
MEQMFVPEKLVTTTCMDLKVSDFSVPLHDDKLLCACVYHQIQNPLSFKHLRACHLGSSSDMTFRSVMWGLRARGLHAISRCIIYLITDT